MIKQVVRSKKGGKYFYNYKTETALIGMANRGDYSKFLLEAQNSEQKMHVREQWTIKKYNWIYISFVFLIWLIFNEIVAVVIAILVGVIIRIIMNYKKDSYQIFANDYLWGICTCEKGAYSFQTDSGYYELRLHSNNILSVMKNDLQVALIFRKDMQYESELIYELTFQKENINLLEVLFFCIFCDKMYFDVSPMRQNENYIKTYIANDLYIERTKWRPAITEN